MASPVKIQASVWRTVDGALGFGSPPTTQGTSITSNPRMPPGAAAAWAARLRPQTRPVGTYMAPGVEVWRDGAVAPGQAVKRQLGALPATQGMPSQNASGVAPASPPSPQAGRPRAAQSLKAAPSAIGGEPAVRAKQQMLVAHGYDIPVDGVDGPRTRAATRHFDAATSRSSQSASPPLEARSAAVASGLIKPRTPAGRAAAAQAALPMPKTARYATQTGVERLANGGLLFRLAGGRLVEQAPGKSAYVVNAGRKQSQARPFARKPQP